MWAKRVFDLLFTIPGVVILAPLFIFISIWIKLDSLGPVLFKQERVGKNGHRFNIYKFRTMIHNAEKYGLPITVGNDRRITRCGGFLRKWKLDELPQLFNVLKGEMSLVGPRPEVPYYVNMYSQDERAVLNLLPGITDPASIKYRNESELLAACKSSGGISLEPEKVYIKEIMPEKIRLNLEYARKASVFTDFKIILLTLFHFIPVRR